MLGSFSGLDKRKDVSMNEEKEPKWFVWERVSRGGMVGNIQPSIYRGMPRTGSGQAQDDYRFIFKHKVLLDQDDWSVDRFVINYPCPVERDKIGITRETDLTRNEMTRETKKEHLGEFKITGAEAQKILDELYPDEKEKSRIAETNSDAHTTTDGVAGKDSSNPDTSGYGGG